MVRRADGRDRNRHPGTDGTRAGQPGHREQSQASGMGLTRSFTESPRTWCSSHRRL